MPGPEAQMSACRPMREHEWRRPTRSQSRGCGSDQRRRSREQSTLDQLSSCVAVGQLSPSTGQVLSEPAPILHCVRGLEGYWTELKHLSIVDFLWYRYSQDSAFTSRKVLRGFGPRSHPPQGPRPPRTPKRPSKARTEVAPLPRAPHQPFAPPSVWRMEGRSRWPNRRAERESEGRRRRTTANGRSPQRRAPQRRQDQD